MLPGATYQEISFVPYYFVITEQQYMIAVLEPNAMKKSNVMKEKKLTSKIH